MAETEVTAHSQTNKLAPRLAHTELLGNTQAGNLTPTTSKTKRSNSHLGSPSIDSTDTELYYHGDSENSEGNFQQQRKNKKSKKNGMDTSIGITKQRDFESELYIITECKDYTNTFQVIDTLERKEHKFKAKIKKRIINSKTYFAVWPETELSEQILLNCEFAKFEKINKEKKEHKAVLLRVPVDLPEEHIAGRAGITQAIRYRRKVIQDEGIKHFPTNRVQISYTGALKTEFNLGAFGTYQAEHFIPDPMRCLRCQSFNHHRNNCTVAKMRCGWCAENHDSHQCIDKPIKDRPPSKCVNCEDADHASSWSGCPFMKSIKQSRLNKIRPNKENKVENTQQNPSSDNTKKTHKNTTDINTNNMQEHPPPQATSTPAKTDAKHTNKGNKKQTQNTHPKNTRNSKQQR